MHRTLGLGMLAAALLFCGACHAWRSDWSLQDYQAYYHDEYWVFTPNTSCKGDIPGYRTTRREHAPSVELALAWRLPWRMRTFTAAG